MSMKKRMFDQGLLLKSSFVLLLLVFGQLVSAQDKLLNDDFIQKQLAAFEQAYAKRQTAFFAEMFTDTATLTIHSRQRDNKSAIQYSKEEILQGELFKHPNPLAQLQRVDEHIEYYNDNTQALLTYKMKPKSGSDFGGERGYLVDTQMLFQLVKGEPKIVSVITHIDFEPAYQAKPSR